MWKPPNALCGTAYFTGVEWRLKVTNSCVLSKILCLVHVLCIFDDIWNVVIYWPEECFQCCSFSILTLVCSREQCVQVNWNRWNTVFLVKAMPRYSHCYIAEDCSMQASLGTMKYLIPSVSKGGRIAIIVVNETQKSNFSTSHWHTFFRNIFRALLGKLQTKISDTNTSF